jgi:hypothetical protein
MGRGEVPAAQGSGVVRDVSIALISMLGSIAVAWIAIVAREFASAGTVRGAINSAQTRDAVSFRGARLEYRITDVQRADTTQGQGGRTALASAAEP